jgi:hypothetical protein
MNRRNAIKAAIAGLAAVVGWKRVKALPYKPFFYADDETANPVLYRGIFPGDQNGLDLLFHESLPKIYDVRHDGMYVTQKQVQRGTDGYWEVTVTYEPGRKCWECEQQTADVVCHHCGFDSGPQPDGGLLIPPRFNAHMEQLCNANRA